MSGDIRNKLNVQTGGKENSESEGGKSKFGRGKPKRDIAAPFQPSPSVATPKVCPLTYRDRPPNRIDYISCHFPELDSGGDITFEKVSAQNTNHLLAIHVSASMWDQLRSRIGSFRAKFLLVLILHPRTMLKHLNFSPPFLDLESPSLFVFN